jgi:glucose-6-phosphate 1-epimerase
VCWPWFGPAAQPAHGKARIALWDFEGARAEADGSTTICLGLDMVDEFELVAKMYINVGAALTVCLSTSNTGTEAYPLSEALHTYFAISEITKIAVLGLAKEDLPDPEFPGYKEDGTIRFERETDLVCQPGNKILAIQDDGWNRMIRVECFGSKSAVVWNPWIEKAQRMPDFGDEEYHTMVCVEAANAKDGTIILEPGTTHTIGTRISLV